MTFSLVSFFISFLLLHLLYYKGLSLLSGDVLVMYAPGEQGMLR